MPCYHPLRGWLSRDFNDNGNRYIVFKFREGFSDVEYKIPCGQCIGCKLERSRQWAVRCVHEASLYEENCFITLTFDDYYLPKDGSLHKEDFQKFMKRLRKKFSNKKIRYFHCGEYGELLNRPHHHACLFNHDFNDKYLFNIKNGVKLYRSETLEDLWNYGYCTIGDVNFESASYIARYCTKKITGKDADKHYNGKLPEYVTMSRRNGIGHDWFLKYKKDVYPHDYLVIRDGVKCKPPKYYDSIYDLTNKDDFAKIKSKRTRLAIEDKNSTQERLYVREACKKSRINLLKRSYENGKANF